MPNIISQEITSSGISIIANGRSFSLSFEDIKSRHDQEIGPPTIRKGLVISWFKRNLFNIIGDHSLGQSHIDFDFDSTNGHVTRIKLG